MKVLVTGGAGYIGSTIVSACAEAGILPVVLDNLATGRPEFTQNHVFYPGDVADGPLVDQIFAEHPEIFGVIHCAALTVVDESVRNPVHYYRENVGKTVDFVDHLLRNGCQRLIFSSSAAVYGSVASGRVTEESPLDPQSPYARTKAMVDTFLRDTTAASGLRAVSLRYFNPIGADPRLRSGQQNPAPTHVLGRLVTARATGLPFQITGVDWPTRDGSGIRDYIHVWDLAQAHVAAVREFDRVVPPGSGVGHEVVNLGTGTGTTVRELVTAFEQATGERLAIVETGRRPGDVIGGHTEIHKAERLLGWRPTLSVRVAIEDALRWEEIRPQRFRSGAVGTDLLRGVRG